MRLPDASSATQRASSTCVAWLLSALASACSDPPPVPNATHRDELVYGADNRRDVYATESELLSKSGARKRRRADRGKLARAPIRRSSRGRRRGARGFRESLRIGGVPRAADRGAVLRRPRQRSAGAHGRALRERRGNLRRPTLGIRLCRARGRRVAGRGGGRRRLSVSVRRGEHEGDERRWPLLGLRLGRAGSSGVTAPTPGEACDSRAGKRAMR